MNPALAAVLGFQENPLPVGGGFQEDDLLGLYEESAGASDILVERQGFQQFHGIA